MYLMYFMYHIFFYFKYMLYLCCVIEIHHVPHKYKLHNNTPYQIVQIGKHKNRILTIKS